MISHSFYSAFNRQIDRIYGQFVNLKDDMLEILQAAVTAVGFMLVEDIWQEQMR